MNDITYEFYREKPPNFLIKKYSTFEVELTYYFDTFSYRDRIIDATTSSNLKIETFFHSTNPPSFLNVKTASSRKNIKYNYYSKCDYFLISYTINKNENTITFKVWNKAKTPISNISRRIKKSINSIYQYYDFYDFSSKNMPLIGITYGFHPEIERIPKVNILLTPKFFFKVKNLVD